MANTTFYLFKAEDASRAGHANGHAGDVDFPTSVGGWTEVLDCRHTPYTEQTIAENCEFALGVRKVYILVNEAQLSKEHPAG